MIYEHEIPKGSRLYFGKSAKLKRDIENRASEILYKNGYEEIVTPIFSYHQNFSIEDKKELIRINDEFNRDISLRADSTIDVIRIITKRLGRSTTHKKWFYIQSVFRYPTYEYNQIGAELLGSSKSQEILKIVLSLFDELKIKPLLQISNIKIAKILNEDYNIPLDVLKSANIEYLLSVGEEWIKKLIYIKKPDQIDDLIGEIPQKIEDELLKMKELCDFIEYEKIIIAPLYYAKMRYYDDLFFRFIEKNMTLCKGGNYKSENLEAAGFALYTDNLIEILEDKGIK
ncbi:ATP phosphoribosyltransferase regulatory subunit [Nitrosophilus kaiyonis]|uniref:ATP phosphoribosyltransferase regulatory subunit n=1 Tax=Nitrosophilus kaiyonis TaxID=2930200 RepID=UPI0024917C7B|nr:ATP phosphoribosyltransferase regulatory subunit [Nitrosophilus kaiyonis]